MTHAGIHDTNITNVTSLRTPEQVRASLPLPSEKERQIISFRTQAKEIIEGKDPRLMAVVGPCSVHNPQATLRYAKLLKTLADEVRDTLFVVMRVFFEKPRTCLGWKGLINDPYLDGSFRINDGIVIARKLLLDITGIGLPAGTEALDPVSPQYLGDLTTWTAIGARTAESQPHREMASGLSTPVGFKNSTNGSLAAAINAVKFIRQPHHFFGVTQSGQVAVYHTAGNVYGHVILRGGTAPNYDPAEVQRCAQELKANGLPANIVIDAAHANSEKDPARQAVVLDSCVGQVVDGNQAIMGMMLESNLSGGSQPIPRDPLDLDPDTSVTDPCIDWPTTQQLLREAHCRLKPMVRTRRNCCRLWEAVD